MKVVSGLKEREMLHLTNCPTLEKLGLARAVVVIVTDEVIDPGEAESLKLVDHVTQQAREAGKLYVLDVRQGVPPSRHRAVYSGASIPALCEALQSTK